jgi:hypothetical protein
MGMTPNERALNREFVLNQPQYQGASVLLREITLAVAPRVSTRYGHCKNMVFAW